MQNKMLRRQAASFFFVLSTVLGLSQAQALSAKRLQDETYEQASIRSRENSPRILGNGYDGAQRYQTSIERLSVLEIPEISSAQEMQDHFKFVRDTKFITDSSLDFSRRSSWLYPDDGCYIRAEVASHNLVEKGYAAPKKIFVFGNLHARTKNAPAGFVSWWYHVAVTYRLGPVAYVFDPAINPNKVLTLQEWDEAIGGNSSRLQYAICDTNAVDPDSSCKEPHKRSYQAVLNEQLGFLDDEWQRLEDLHRDPVKELGDNPPWVIQ